MKPSLSPQGELDVSFLFVTPGQLVQIQCAFFLCFIEKLVLTYLLTN
jgi:hypothetical protein